jgi:hypothetical protein
MPTLNQRFPSRELPEIFRATERAAASRATTRGELRRLARGLYTTNLDEPAEQLIRRRWMDVAALYFPGAVIVDRSAVEGRPSEDGSLFLDSGPKPRPSTRELPGLTLRPRSGPGPLSDDMPFGDLHRSSQARTALDNMRPSRARKGIARTLDRGELEQWLERIAQTAGEEELLRIRDQARRIAPELNGSGDQRDFDSLIASLLGTGESTLQSDAGRARGARSPYDSNRLALFERLHGALSGHIFPVVPERPDPNRVFAFFEAYFSNFIEGTEFDLDEAREIIFEGSIPSERPADAHDIIGTFEALTDPELRSRTPRDADDLLELAVTLNRRILVGRPETKPGEIKTVPNRAGGTSFVAPEMVRGTLREAWRFYSTLGAGMPRALFAMFTITEVHPFADGNGRTARAITNAELSADGKCRLLIPLAFRPDYLGALRALSRQQNPEPLIRVGERLQDWATRIDFSSMQTATEAMQGTNALVPSDQAETEGLILLDPADAGRRGDG